MSLRSNVTRTSGGNVRVVVASSSKKRRKGNRRPKGRDSVDALARWEQDFLESLMNIMQDTIPSSVATSNVLKKRTEEVFAIIFDLADREKDGGGGTDMRKSKRPSKFARTLKREAAKVLANAHIRVWGRVKTALMSWQQTFMEEVVDAIEEIVPGGLSGILDKRTWFRMNKVMDLATQHMSTVQANSNYGKMSRSRKTASLREALINWQQSLLEDLMDLVDEVVPGGMMNAKRIWLRINEVMDLVWKISPTEASLRRAKVGQFKFRTASHRSAWVLTALTQWQQVFLERLVMMLDDNVKGGAWQKGSNRKKVEEVFDIAFRMVAEGDVVQPGSPQESGDGFSKTRKNQHKPSRFTKK